MYILIPSVLSKVNKKRRFIYLNLNVIFYFIFEKGGSPFLFK